MKLRTKIIGGFSIITLMMAVVVAIYQLTVQRTTSGFNGLLEGNVAVLMHAGQVEEAMLQCRSEEKDFLLNKDIECQGHLREHVAIIQRETSAIKSIAQQIDDQQMADMAETITEHSATYQKQFDLLVAAQVKAGLDQISGFQGAFSKVANGLQETLPEHDMDILFTALLEMRRNEKDYYRVASFEHRDVFILSMEYFTGILEVNLGDPVAKKQIQEAFNSYEQATNKYMTSQNNLEKAELYYTMRKTAATMETAIKTVKVPAALAMLELIRLHEKDYLLSKDTKYIAMIHESIASLIKAFEEAGVLAKHVDDIKFRLNAYAENFNALVGEYQAIDKALAVLQSTANIIEPLTREIYQNSLTKTNSESAEISTKARALTIIALAIALGLMTVSLLIAFFLASSIVKPINETNKRLRDIADGEGDLTSRLVVKSGDELGELGGNFNRFVENQQELIREIADNVGALNIDSTALSDLSVQLASGSEEMSAQTGSVAGAVEEMTMNINTMAGTAEEMSMNTQTVSSSAEQMSLNVDMIATSIEEMSKAIQDVSGRAREGSDIAVTAMEMSDTATTTMGALSEAAKQIGNVTEVIKRIADQTNLLALNATIEAASAGDAGKGFAVVANEIKELARQSAHAASDIAERIEGVQKNTGGALNIINDVSEIIGNINESSLGITTVVEQQSLATNEISSNVQEVNKGVNNIATAISEVAKGANDMAQSSAESSQGINEVSANIQGVNKTTNESSAIARQVNKSAEGFAHVAEKLQKMVGKFKVD